MSPMSQPSVISSTFQVIGMTCDHCVRAVATEIRQIPAVNNKVPAPIPPKQ